MHIYIYMNMCVCLYVYSRRASRLQPLLGGALHAELSKVILLDI